MRVNLKIVLAVSLALFALGAGIAAAGRAAPAGSGDRDAGETRGVAPASAAVAPSEATYDAAILYRAPL